QVRFVLSRFEDFDYPDRAYEFVNAEFSLPFISAAAFPSVFTKLMDSVKIGGLFTGQLFGPNDSWNLPESGMNFHSRSDVERLLRGWTVLELTEEGSPGQNQARRGQALAHLPYHRSANGLAAATHYKGERPKEARLAIVADRNERPLRVQTV